MSKVLLNFFQKIVRVWGEPPKVFYYLKSILREFEGAFTIEKHPQHYPICII